METLRQKYCYGQSSGEPFQQQEGTEGEMLVYYRLISQVKGQSRAPVPYAVFLFPSERVMFMQAALSEAKVTPLYAAHVALGAKMITFAGYFLPVQYAGIMEEHRAVRERAGLFDVSHMGELIVRGPAVESYLQRLLTNDVSRLVVGRAQYNLMCYDDGGVIDDLIVYHKSTQEYLLVVNANNIAKDLNWLREHSDEHVEVLDLSAEFALIALQGPRAAEILQPLADFGLSTLKYFYFRPGKVGGIDCLIPVRYRGPGRYCVRRTARNREDSFGRRCFRGNRIGEGGCGLLQPGFRKGGENQPGSNRQPRGD